MNPPSCLLIGNFDGVHRGHQGLIAQAVLTAREFGYETAVLTFDPHPTRILAPERAAPLLLTLERKQELLCQYGVDRVVVQPFDVTFSQKTPREFVQEVIAPLNARHIFVGADFCFGNKRSGTIETLKELAEEFGYAVHAPSLMDLDGEAVSSSRVRQALTDGHLALVQRLLGRSFDFEGIVVQGNQRGRTIGFPTANLVTRTNMIPKNGVYAVRVSWLENGTPRNEKGLMNIGTRPTIEQNGTPKRTIEVHLLDFTGDLYGKILRIECIQHLRDEQKFPDIEALKIQIQRDEMAARLILSASFIETPPDKTF